MCLLEVRREASSLGAPSENLPLGPALSCLGSPSVSWSVPYNGKNTDTLSQKGL